MASEAPRTVVSPRRVTWDDSSARCESSVAVVEIARDDALNDPVRVALAFGYALYPDEGDDAETLLDRAREPRIRMV